MTQQVTTYFHFAPLRLGPGSIIHPGNFGRILRRYTLNDAQGGWRLARELIFEQIRCDKFDDKPSRMNACFALPTKVDADAYRTANDPNYIQVLHEVELVDTSARRHVAALSWIDAVQGPYLDPTRMRALEYWKGTPGDSNKGNELVTVSALRVVQCHE